MGISYFFIHYSSEARGYAPALFFCFLAIYALWHGREKRFTAWMLAYWVSATLALFSHAGSAELLLACGVWSLVYALTTIQNWKQRLLFVACWQAVPAGSAVWLYLAFLRHVKNGAGPVSSVTEVFSAASAYTFGLPISLGSWIGIPLVALVIFVALAYFIRRKRWALLAFFLAGIFSAIVPICWRPENMQLFPRYFILNLALVILLGGLLLQRLLEGGWVGKIAAWVAILLFVGGNAIHIRALATYGRGEYKKAVTYIAAHSAPGEVTIGSDNDFRNFTVLGYYERVIRPDRWFGFYKFGTADMAGPQWLLVHRRDGQAPPDRNQPGPLGPQYRLAQSFHHSALSGFDWYLYRNIYLNGQY
jgi:hypothetical protein